MSVSMNERAAAVVEAMVADADALGIAVRRLDRGARLIDCSAEARGGLQAGLGFAAACMGGLGRIDPVPVRVGERTWPGVGVAVDHPAGACLAAQYAGWKLERNDFFAMASGPGRALARAEDLFEELSSREEAGEAVLCLETRQEPPAEIVEKVSERCRVPTSAVTFLIAPTASVCGSVQISARVVETALHKLHELGVDPGRVRHGWGCCPIAPVAKERPHCDRADQRRRAVRRHRSPVDRGRRRGGRGPRDKAAVVCLGGVRHPVRGALESRRLELLNFYEIDPMLFSPAAATLTSTESGRAHHGGGLAPEVLERSFTQ